MNFELVKHLGVLQNHVNFKYYFLLFRKMLFEFIFNIYIFLNLPHIFFVLIEGSDGYKYEWTLISHPEGDETGTMEDQNTKNLKLSKVIYYQLLEKLTLFFKLQTVTISKLK